MPRSRGLLENDKQLLGISLFQLYRHTISSDCSTQKKKVKSLLFNVDSSFSCDKSMEADGAPFTPLPLSVLCFTGIQSYSDTDQRKVETDVRSLKIEPETSRSERYALVT